MVGPILFKPLYCIMSEWREVFEWMKAHFLLWDKVTGENQPGRRGDICPQTVYCTYVWLTADLASKKMSGRTENERRSLDVPWSGHITREQAGTGLSNQQRLIFDSKNWSYFKNEWMITIEQKYECLNQNTDAQVFCEGGHILDWLSLQPLYFLTKYLPSKFENAVKPKALLSWKAFTLHIICMFCTMY